MAETYKETKTMLEELISAFLRILFDRMASREMVNFTDRLQQRVEKEMDNITKSIGSQPATGEQRSDGKTSSRLTLSSQDISTLLAQLNQAMSQQQKEIALLRQELAQLTAAISVGQCRLVDDRQIHECTALKVEHSTIEHAED
jgi:uncharacterized coiled-coil protein SlyX